jgi:hypothetical protein
MSGLVCLNCGKEMEYDWAPCPHCGWKPPEPWEEEEENTPSHPVLQKPNPWVKWTTWILLVLGLGALLLRVFRS